jgi:chromosome segregation ATPase
VPVVASDQQLAWLGMVLGVVVALITIIGSVVAVVLAYASLRGKAAANKRQSADLENKCVRLEQRIDTLAARVDANGESIVSLVSEEREKRGALELKLVQEIAGLRQDLAGWQGELRVLVDRVSRPHEGGGS